MSEHSSERHKPNSSPAGETSPSDPSEVTLPRKEYQELCNRSKELEDLRERLLRSAADFENAKKRLTRERDEFVKFSQENLIREILPALDNFERALAHAESSDSDGKKNLKGLAAGIRMVLKQLGEILKNQGLKRLKTVGEIFDPHQHEAVGFVQEPGKENEIVEEIEAGYTLHDRLLRAAKVRVRASHPVDPPKSGPTAEEKQEEIT